MIKVGSNCHNCGHGKHEGVICHMGGPGADTRCMCTKFVSDTAAALKSLSPPEKQNIACISYFMENLEQTRFTGFVYQDGRTDLVLNVNLPDQLTSSEEWVEKNLPKEALWLDDYLLARFGKEPQTPAAPS